MAPGAPALPCTHCGDCRPACPEGLSAVALRDALLGNDDAGALALGLDACTGCGRCDLVCPSRIALSALLLARREQLRERAVLLQRAAQARLRFQARNARLQREAEERAARERETRESATSDDAVEAAIARALARRRAPGNAP